MMPASSSAWRGQVGLSLESSNSEEGAGPGQRQKVTHLQALWVVDSSETVQGRGERGNQTLTSGFG